MPTDFSTALALIKAITGTAKRLSDTREEVKVNEVSIQLQGIVLDLQSEMMMIQSDYQSALRAKEQLEKQLVDQEGWQKERARYHLKKVGTIWAGFVYALNVSNPSVEPAHWLCAQCYQDGKKSIIQNVEVSTWHCARCKADIMITGFPS